MGYVIREQIVPIKLVEVDSTFVLPIGALEILRYLKINTMVFSFMLGDEELRENSIIDERLFRNDLQVNGTKYRFYRKT